MAFEGIEKGILEDGQNLKTEPNVFAVGGEGNPSIEGVEKFALQLSGYVGTEIGGAQFSAPGSESVTHMTLGGYEGNSYDENKSSGVSAIRKITSTTNEFLSYKLRAKFHTHPNEATRFNPSRRDGMSRDEALKQDPNLLFYIITYPTGRGKFPHKVDYTKTQIK